MSELETKEDNNENIKFTPENCIHFGRSHLSESDHLKQDYERAHFYFQKAINQNYALGHLYLGNMYFAGHVGPGGKGGIERGMQLYKDGGLCGGVGSAECHHQLAQLHYAGKAGHQDLMLAEFYASKAVAGGYVQSAVVQWNAALRISDTPTRRGEAIGSVQGLLVETPNKRLNQYLQNLIAATKGVNAKAARYH